jgi:hypothetical protein
MVSGSRWLLGVVAVLVLLAVPAAVRAARPATPEEHAAVAGAAGFAVECTHVTVSTVDLSWARLDGAPVAGCPEGNGFIVMHFVPGRGWGEAAQGSEEFSCVPYDVPTRVGEDLHACRKAKTYVLCRVQDEDTRVPREKPKTCTTLGPRDSFAEALNLASLSWKNWGKSEATAHGIERGFHLPLQHVKVTVRAYRKRLGDCGDYIYTRVRARSKFGQTVAKLPARCGDHY